MQSDFILPWLLLGIVLLLVSCSNLGTVDPSPACPPGVGRGTWSLGSPKGDDANPGNTGARRLLKSPNFGATPRAADGLPNTHYFGRAADIWWVDGKPVEGNARDPDVLKVGKRLAGIPPGERPDQIIGPPEWSEALGYGREDGWVLAPDQLKRHRDHIHIGYMDRSGTRNTR